MFVVLLIAAALLLWLLLLGVAPSGAFVAGKNSRVAVNGVNLTMADWSGSFKGTILEVTNFESLGFYEGILGIQSFDWTVSGTWNAANTMNPGAGNPPQLYPTDSGGSLRLYVNQNGAATYQFPTYICSQGTAHPTATGLVAFNASGTSQGTFTATA